MSDETDHKGADNTVGISSGSVEMPDDKCFDIVNADISLDSSNTTPLSAFEGGDIRNNTEFEGSFEVRFTGQDVVCPDCGGNNTVPTSPWLDILTDEPVPCRVCGYPLL